MVTHAVRTVRGVEARAIEVLLTDGFVATVGTAPVDRGVCDFGRLHVWAGNLGVVLIRFDSGVGFGGVFSRGAVSRHGFVVQNSPARVVQHAGIPLIRNAPRSRSVSTYTYNSIGHKATGLS